MYETRINAQGHLELCGRDAVELAGEHGTPLYVFDENYVRGICRQYAGALKDWPAGGRAYYASKAFSCLAMCKIAYDEGLGIDASSPGEMMVALRAGVPARFITMHGNNKKRDELELAVDKGVGTIVVDGLHELEMLKEIATQKRSCIRAQLRLRPGIDAHTHDKIKTATIDCKFGLGVGDGQALAAVRSALECEYIDLAGLSCHIGSQIFDIAPYEQLIGVFLELRARIHEEHSVWLPELNFGGGFGVRYVEGDRSVIPADAAELVKAALKSACEAQGQPLPYIIFEPGRSIIAEGVTALYTVGSVKEIQGIRTYVSLDGGIADNPRVALYDAKYTFKLANRMNEPDDGVYTIAGRCCETGDMLGWDVPLPKPKVGDIVAVSSMGAYTYSMSSNYNKLPRVKIVAVGGNGQWTMVERESYEDMMRCDRMPEWLK